MRLSRPRAIGLRSIVQGILITLVVSSAALALLTRVVPMTGRSAMVVAGPSMTPAITLGSLVILEPAVPTSLRVGDVVSLRSSPTTAIFTHRIVRLVERDGAPWLETKGDANATADPALLPAADVIGRVTMSVPYLGYLVAIAASPSGLLLIVLPGFLLLVAGWLLERQPSGRVAATA